MNLLSALTNILDLDSHFPEDMHGMDSTMFAIETVKGFNRVESLLEHPN